MKREVKVFVTTQHETKSLSFKIGFNETGLDLDELELMHEFMMVEDHNRVPVDVLADILEQHYTHSICVDVMGKPMQYTYMMNMVKEYAD